MNSKQTMNDFLVYWFMILIIVISFGVKTTSRAVHVLDGWYYLAFGLTLLVISLEFTLFANLIIRLRHRND